jgi:Mg-chelatase subunit ChlD
MRAPRALIFAAVIAATAVAGAQSQEGFRFKSGVDLVNVTATVTDEDGRFVSGLRREDFTIYEDGKLQDVSHFSNDRVPVSLGIVLDTSGSMSPDKMSAARSAIDRLIYDLLGKEDELFLVDFSTRARLRQDWTTDRALISRAVREVNATGGTAIYDAVATAIPTAQAGMHVKKALLLISDGNDTNSSTMPWASTARGGARKPRRQCRSRCRCPSHSRTGAGPGPVCRRSAVAAAAGGRARRATASMPTPFDRSPTIPAGARRSLEALKDSGRPPRGSPTN